MNRAFVGLVGIRGQRTAHGRGTCEREGRAPTISNVWRFSAAGSCGRRVMLRVPGP